MPNNESKCVCLPLFGQRTRVNTVSLRRLYPFNQYGFPVYEWWLFHKYAQSKEPITEIERQYVLFHIVTRGKILTNMLKSEELKKK